MLVTEKNLPKCIKEIKKEKIISLDTETTGLNAYKEDTPFSCIISTSKENYYFNFNKLASSYWDKETKMHKYKVTIPSKFMLPSWDIFKPILKDPNKTIFMQNALFDLSMLAKMGLTVDANVICTIALGRLVNNLLPTYSLAYLSKLIGEEKSDLVEKYISEHKLYIIDKPEGKKTKKRVKVFYQHVPFDIISKYGMQDGKVTLSLGKYELKRLSEINKTIPKGRASILQVMENEIDLTKVLFEMQQVGIKVNKSYCKKAWKYECTEYLNAAQEFEDLVGFPFEDGKNCLVKAFAKLDLEYPETAKGNPSFAADVLEALDNPVANIINRYRKSFKRAGTYFKAFLDLMDANGVIHCSLNSFGAKHGRFSCSNPNLQNVPRGGSGEDINHPYPLKRVFVPRKDFFFLMIDYAQVEFRLLLEYAEEMEMIEAINNGLDPHQATAELVGIPRQQAKHLNFKLLYGIGGQAIADELKISLQEAYNLKEQYFRNLPNVKQIIDDMTYTAKDRGYVYNWLGRKCFVDPDKAFTASCNVIAGGVGDIIKVAMVRIHEYLKSYKSRQLLSIHDEILFEIHKTEKKIIPELKNIMENVYPSKYLPLTVSMDYSTKSWFDKKEYKI